jgi:hypothetical protein
LRTSMSNQSSHRGLARADTATRQRWDAIVGRLASLPKTPQKAPPDLREPPKDQPLELPDRPWGDPVVRTRRWRVALGVVLIAAAVIFIRDQAWEWPWWSLLIYGTATVVVAGFAGRRLFVATWERRLTAPKPPANIVQAGEKRGEYGRAMADPPNLDDVRRRANNLGIGCRKRADAHRHSQSRWKAVAIGLAIAIAVFSGAAGATLLASAKSGSTLAYIAGAVGVAAAILTAVNTNLAPQAEAKAHSLAHVGERGFSTAYFELGQLAADYDRALADLQAIRERKEQWDQAVPVPTEEWAMKKAEAKEAGRQEQRKAGGRAAGD